MLKKFHSGKKIVTKNALFFLSHAPSHHNIITLNVTIPFKIKIMQKPYILLLPDL